MSDKRLEVMKLTTKDGRLYYNCDHCPELIQATLQRCPDWKSIELIEMTEAEYYAIPATNESARFWDIPQTFDARPGKVK